MKRKLGLGALVLAGSLAGCGSGGGSASGGTPLASTSASSPSGPAAPMTPSGVGPSSMPLVAVSDLLAMPAGYEQPRGVALMGATVYVTARESATQKAVILALHGKESQVVATGDVPGTANAMTDPVALAAANGQLYVADFSSNFSPGASGAILAVNPASGAVSVLSAGSIDAPTGLTARPDGSLAVCGADPADGLGAVFSVTKDGSTTLLAKGGALTQPAGIGTTPNGTLMVADQGRRQARAQLVSVSSNGGTAAQVATIDDSCPVATGLAATRTKLFATARHGDAGKLSAFALTGSPEEVALEGAPFVAPAGAAADGANLYVADSDATGPGEIVVLR